MRTSLIVIFLLASSFGSSLQAASILYTGSLLRDNEVRLVTATFSELSSVTFRSYSYAGGVSTNGTVIQAGGFDPLLDIFNSAGLLINENDDGGNLVPADPVTLQTFDILLQATLPAGTYTIALAQYDNFANGPNLSDGFFESDPSFTKAFGCPAGRFCDITGANRMTNYALEITSSPATIPEPGMPALFAVGLSAVACFIRKQYR